MTHNPAKALEKVKILLDLEQIPGNKTLIGISILTAIRLKVKPDEIINFIKDYYLKNDRMMVRIVGEDLAVRICEF